MNKITIFILLMVTLNEIKTQQHFIHRSRRSTDSVKEKDKHKDKEDKEDKDKLTEDDAVTDANLVDCSTDHCSLVHKFVIPDNNSLNCHDVLLPIKYKTNNLTKTGFIKEGSNKIFDKQSFSGSCKRIKR
jgi:hypothetical protein